MSSCAVSDAISFVRPMKAKQTNRVKRVVGGEKVTIQLTAEEMIEWAGTLDPNTYWAEVKWNGQRGEFQKDGWWTTRPIWEPAARYEHICSFIPEGCVLDGELMPNDGEGHEVVSHYRSKCPEKLKLIAFDILYWRGKSIMHWPLRDRRELLMVVLKECAYGSQIVPNDIIQDDFGEAMRKALHDGREGLIIKTRDSIYKPGSRSQWLKCKATETVDVVITDCNAKPTEWRVRPGCTGKDGIFYPEGRHSDPWIAGHVGLSYGFYDQAGTLHRVGSLGFTGPRESIKKHVGRVAEVTSFGPQFPTGAIQHPSFEKWRDDKDPKGCVFGFYGSSKSPKDTPPITPPFDVEAALDLILEH